MKDNLVATIGLEIHAELATKSKMFCACVNNPDEEKPNVNICPICMGHPGTLPVLNHEAIRQVVRMGYAVGGRIADFTEWDRKNYFYPDIPKGYQISQYKYPLVTGGTVAGVDITRIHLEEDTAQSTHDAPNLPHRNISDKSLVNFNRAGVPLMELVTEPVIHDAATAVRFAKELQLLLRALGAGEANMEKGELRVEANISLASAEDTAVKKFGTKTEVKNLNSFRAVERAIEYEIERQTKLIVGAKNGEKNADGTSAVGAGVVQETRGWDENTQKTFSQRAKESAHDYRYFPDPDIPKMKVSEIVDFSKEAIVAGLPELPWASRVRYKAEYAMTDKEAEIFVEHAEVGDYFNKIIAQFSGAEADTKKKIRLTINYLLSDYIGLLKKEHGETGGFNHITQVTPDYFAELIELIASGKVNSRGAKDLLLMMLSGSDRPTIIAEKEGLIQKDDPEALEKIKKIAEEIVAVNPKVVADYKAGKAAAFQFFIGQGMKLTKGSANPDILKEIFLKILG